MVKEKAVVRFYNITHCGYYHGREGHPRFGESGAIFEDLKDWIHDRPLVETKTYESGGEKDLMSSYVLDMAPIGNEWLLKIWNEVPAHAGKYHAADANSVVGAPTISSSAIKPNSIPGYATYFWVFPEKKLLASIRFKHQTTGQPSFQHYVECFMARNSKFVVAEAIGAQPKEAVIKGYRAISTSTAEDLMPRFRTCLHTKPGAHDLFIKRAENIIKVIKKTRLRLSRTEDNQVWQQVLDWLGLRAPQKNRQILSTYDIKSEFL